MPAPPSYDFAAVRVVPRVDREEFINAGVILHCPERRYLRALIHVDDARLRALWPACDPVAIRGALEAFPAIAAGAADAGPIARLPMRERFHWLVAPRSTMVQISPVHTGLGDNPDATLERLFRQLVLPPPFTIRPAVPNDVPVLRELIEASVRGLQTADYTPPQIEGALATVFGIDSQLIADGTYLVAETASGEIAGCGGWSRRRTLFGGDRWTAREDDPLDPARDPAKIRAFFIHPAWARRGVGTAILGACEAAAAAAGFTRFEMGATLTGVPLYRARGYVEVEPLSVPLNNGESLPIVRMVKSAIRR